MRVCVWQPHTFSVSVSGVSSSQEGFWLLDAVLLGWVSGRIHMARRPVLSTESLPPSHRSHAGVMMTVCSYTAPELSREGVSGWVEVEDSGLRVWRNSSWWEGEDLQAGLTVSRSVTTKGTLLLPNGTERVTSVEASLRLSNDNQMQGEDRLATT